MPPGGGVTGTVHVFCGETITRQDAAGIVPAAVTHPPAWAGDLPRLHAGPGDCVVLVDGPLRHADPVRHRDILDLLARGAAVIGAGGLGAVRAAEMHLYGMTGAGVVYAALRNGSMTDDEAAGALLPAGCPSGPEALRAALAAASGAGALDPGEARLLARRAGQPAGTPAGWQGLAVAAGPDLAPALARFRAWAERRARIGYARACDARDALRQVACGALPCARPGRPLVPLPRGAPAPAAVGAGLPPGLRRHQLHDPGFPARWRRHVLTLAGSTTAGIRPRDLPPGQLGYWLTQREAAELPAAEQAERVVVRAASCDPCAPVWPVTAAAAAALAGPAAPSPCPPVPGPGELALLWGVPPGDLEALTAAARDRGFSSAASALQAAQGPAAAGPRPGRLPR